MASRLVLVSHHSPSAGGGEASGESATIVLGGTASVTATGGLSFWGAIFFGATLDLFVALGFGSKQPSSSMQLAADPLELSVSSELFAIDMHRS